MRLDSVRELKQGLLADVIVPLSRTTRTRTFSLSATAVRNVPQLPRTVALGIARGRGHRDYRLAVRLQRSQDLNAEVERLTGKARGEVDVRFVGRINKRAKRATSGANSCQPAKFQKRVRPLIIGLSIGHFAVTAGTLGAFLRERNKSKPLMLSNNHVLANENEARIGDSILQPGQVDGGRAPRDVVAKLLRFARLNRSGTNLVDCAVASLLDEIPFDAAAVCGMPPLAGDIEAEIDLRVAKVGRTTGLTKGRISAIELDNLVVSFDVGNIRFDNQLEIESVGRGVFSDGGDSGSLIVSEDSDASWAVGLLFAGSDQGGSNGRGLTYANPIEAVYNALGVELL